MDEDGVEKSFGSDEQMKAANRPKTSVRFCDRTELFTASNEQLAITLISKVVAVRKVVAISNSLFLLLQFAFPCRIFF